MKPGNLKVLERVRRMCGITGAVLSGFIGLPTSQGFSQEIPDPTIPVFELNELEVSYSASDFAPKFKGATPQMSYYDSPELPNGYLILALEFMDRYRECAVPGEKKWAAFLLFPILDGYGRVHMKWLCLYFYNDQMFGYDPMANFESEKRFSIPIRYEDRQKQELLYRFAKSYTERVFPEHEQVFYFEELIDPSDPSAGTETVPEFFDVPAGRIASLVPSQKDLAPQELIHLLNEYTEDPNVSQEATPLMGPPADYRKWNFSLKGIWKNILEVPDYLEVGRKLVHPRWGMVVNLYYPQKFLFFGEREAHKRVLMFNVGFNIYSYHPRYGIWRNPAMAADFNHLDTVAGKLQFPGVKSISRIEFVRPEEPGSEPEEPGSEPEKTKGAE